MYGSMWPFCFCWNAFGFGFGDCAEGVFGLIFGEEFERGDWGGFLGVVGFEFVLLESPGFLGVEGSDLLLLLLLGGFFAGVGSLRFGCEFLSLESERDLEVSVKFLLVGSE